jgi:predicted DsbA family dithiol-disulfide isomerase
LRDLALIQQHHLSVLVLRQSRALGRVAQDQAIAHSFFQRAVQQCVNDAHRAHPAARLQQRGVQPLDALHAQVFQADVSDVGEDVLLNCPTILVMGFQT